MGEHPYLVDLDFAPVLSTGLVYELLCPKSRIATVALPSLCKGVLSTQFSYESMPAG